MAESHELRHTYIGTEHLLLGLIREERGIAAQALVGLGATLERVRREAVRLLGTEIRGRRKPAPRTGAGPGLRLIGIRIQVAYEGGTRSEDSFERVEDAITYLQGLSKAQ